jgi:rod shape-determining protein MreC
VSLLRRARRLLVAAALLLLLAVALRASLRAPEQLSPVDRAVIRVTAPLQGALVGLFRKISDGVSRYAGLVRVKADNERLSQENTALRAELQSLQPLAARAERLERLLELRSQVLADTVAAQVVGMETSQQFRVMRLRIAPGGSRLGAGASEVRAGMPVLATGGVVGRIARTAGPVADVQLVTDPKSSIDVVLPRTGSRGVLKGVSDDRRALCRVEYLVQKDTVQLGDLVLTSGLAGLFPRDIPVGKVVRLRKTDASLYQEVEVEPAVDFGRLHEVLVVLSPPPPPDPDAGKRPVEGARGLGVPR